MAVLKTNNLTKRYGHVTALDNLNITIEAGNVYGILGPNGSGKTTTLGLILGILKPDEGSYEWFNGNWEQSPNIKIGAILETPNFFPYLNAVDNLKIVAKIKKVKDPDIDGLLKLVNLDERKKSKFKTYSLGMKQRLAIAATLINNPEVVIFDEPTNGLDPQGITEVRNILKRVADSGRTVIMASHLLAEVEKICTHVAIIKKGKLLKMGPIGSMLSTDKTVELDAVDKVELLKFIRSNSWLKNEKEVNGLIECQMADTYNVADLNKAAFEAGVILTHYVVRNTSLEQEFLEITKGAN
jgi:ABC-2 type transport system ATP-binding protein